MPSIVRLELHALSWGGVKSSMFFVYAFEFVLTTSLSSKTFEHGNAFDTVG